MEDFTERFPHIADKVFQQLDDKSLNACRGVSHYWKHFIDRKKLPWHWQRILQIEKVFQYSQGFPLCFIRFIVDNFSSLLILAITLFLAIL